jgi:adenylate kinase family enzyme
VNGLHGRRRVLVVGCSGAGKSTLSRALGRATGLPVVHLDEHFWQPGWVQSDDEPWRERLEELLARPEWIMDGAYTTSLPRRLLVADAVVRLDVGRARCLAQILQRLVTSYGRTRPDLAEGCPEKFDAEFLKWVWTWHRDEEPKLLRGLAAAPAHVRVWTLRSRGEIARFLEGIDAPGAETPGAGD